VSRLLASEGYGLERCWPRIADPRFDSRLPVSCQRGSAGVSCPGPVPVAPVPRGDGQRRPVLGGCARVDASRAPFGSRRGIGQRLARLAECPLAPRTGCCLSLTTSAQSFGHSSRGTFSCSSTIARDPTTTKLSCATIRRAGGSTTLATQRLRASRSASGATFAITATISVCLALRRLKRSVPGESPNRKSTGHGRDQAATAGRWTGTVPPA
jgi:hypothetical protein